MKKSLKKKFVQTVAGGALLVGVTTGCAISPSGPGLLFTNVKGPIAPTSNSGGSKSGKSCAQNILGMVAVGDASIDEAAKKGGVASVTSVDHSTLSVLGIYTEFCTIVTGN